MCTTASPLTIRRNLRRRRAQARRLWPLHRRGLIQLSRQKLKDLYPILATHHSKDDTFLASDDDDDDDEVDEDDEDDNEDDDEDDDWDDYDDDYDE